MSFTPIVRLDFDGVIHEYTTPNTPWRDDFIPDPVVSGFWEWALDAATKADLVIFSSRCKSLVGRGAILDYLAAQWKSYDKDSGLIEMPKFRIVDEPVPAFVTIDDRALTFNGHWADYPVDRLLAFKPWNK